MVKEIHKVHFYDDVNILKCIFQKYEKDANIFFNYQIKNNYLKKIFQNQNILNIDELLHI